MKRRPLVQGVSPRMRIHRRRLIHDSFADTWEDLKNRPARASSEPKKQPSKSE